jgi:hypothetical protein
MLDTLARRREKLMSFGLKMQPVVLVVGSLSSPTAAYVVADEATWMFSSPLKAIDICFKAFHVFHASYPAESFVWLLVQKLIYGISTKWDARSASVAALISELST